MRDAAPDSFERALAGLDERALARFVADVWNAQGWETRVEDGFDGPRVVCTHDGTGSTRVLTVPAHGRWGLVTSLVGRVRRAVDGTTHSTVDRTDESHEVRPRELYDRVMYGLDRETAADVCRRHLGHGVDAYAGRGPVRANSRGAVAGGNRSDTTRPDRATETDGQDDSDRPAVSTRSVLGVLALLLVVAVVGGGLGSTLQGVGGALTGVAVDEAATGGTTTDPGANTASTGGGSAGGAFAGLGGGTDTDADGFGRERPTALLLAPGLARDGVTSPEALAQAHATQVNGQSYVWNVTYTERGADGVTNATAVHRIRNASVYRIDPHAEGLLRTDPGRLVPPPAYGDGSSRYVIVGGRIHQRTLDPDDHYAGHAEAIFARLFRANGSEVTDDVDGPGVFLHKVSLTGSPDPDRRDYRATMLVTPEGTVHHVEATWRDPTANVTVSVRLSYDFVASPNVTRPGWAWPANRTGDEASVSRPVVTE